jgi:hypothetical protein
MTKYGESFSWPAGRGKGEGGVAGIDGLLCNEKMVGCNMAGWLGQGPEL